ncbi:hypothetical protein F383_28729 [Gossypium arboreum]|uniref:Uncharacterized protein n=1 Tax=Gossypium arboreum TaxID=29729 RepID=A0A0B0PAT2_GOSAR|nr:hypothetical protein F383_28729 [Gossypium arboreum]
MGHLGARFRCIRWYSKCSTGKLLSNLTKNPRGKSMRRISIWLCYEIVQVYLASSGWRSSKILSHYQAIIWGIS